jgi:hypothetical protein
MVCSIPKAMLISGATADYFPLLGEMLSSVLPCAGREGIAIGVLSLGLTAPQCETLRGVGVSVVEPGWDYDFSGFATEPPSWFKALTVRPHLPKYFPGYDHYLWMDADCWVQDDSAILDYLRFADEFGFAITAQCDRSYVVADENDSVAEFKLRCFREFFNWTAENEKVAALLAQFPLLNAGVFAARADAPHWSRWDRALGSALARTRGYAKLIEQTALNVAIRLGEPRTAMLPAIYNWAVLRAYPILGEDGKLLEPQPPFAPIKIIHLAGGAHRESASVRDRKGELHPHDLRFPGPSLFPVAAPIG